MTNKEDFNLSIFDEDFWNNPIKAPYKMSQKEFVEKTRTVLDKICNSYSKAWQSRVLKSDEYPEESVCDKCTGFGTFIHNGEEKECFQDKEQGDCFHRLCDYKQVGMDLETHLDAMFDLLSVDEIN